MAAAAAAANGVLDLQDLPEGCIANVLLFTSPREACRLALVSSAFRSAAESDSVWDRFLPSDYRSIVSRSSLTFHSKKQLYLFLLQNPLLLDGGTMSFQLDKASGKKCYMLSARNLFIALGDIPKYWRWISHTDSRFPEVAQLLSVYWFKIQGSINTGMLSPKTLYEAYFVFKRIPPGSHGFSRPTEVSIGVAGGDTHKQTVLLDVRRSTFTAPHRLPSIRYMLADGAPPFARGLYPKQRADGWLESKLGEFFNAGGEDKEVEMAIEIKNEDWKGGIVVQGIEIRPENEQDHHIMKFYDY